MTHTEKIAAAYGGLALLVAFVTWLFHWLVVAVWWWPLVGSEWRAERRRPEYCAACGGQDCLGIAAVDYCPLWQEAEARNARGEWLTTTPVEWDDEPSTDDDADQMIATWHGTDEQEEQLADVHPIYLDLSDDPDLIVWDAKQQADRCWEIVHIEFPRLRAELTHMWEAAA